MDLGKRVCDMMRGAPGRMRRASGATSRRSSEDKPKPIGWHLVGTASTDKERGHESSSSAAATVAAAAARRRQLSGRRRFKNPTQTTTGCNVKIRLIVHTQQMEAIFELYLTATRCEKHHRRHNEHARMQNTNAYPHRPGQAIRCLHTIFQKKKTRSDTEPKASTNN